MPHYLLSIIHPDTTPPPPALLDGIMRDVTALVDQMRGAGVLVFNGGLEPPSVATVVRANGEKVTTVDGPFAETKEHLGGIVLIDVDGTDEARQWAAKTARATTLPVEVRAFQHTPR